MNKFNIQFRDGTCWNGHDSLLTAESCANKHHCDYSIIEIEDDKLIKNITVYSRGRDYNSDLRELF